MLDSLPFSFGLVISFLTIGILCNQMSISVFDALFFTGALMSAPLQLLLLEESFDFGALELMAVAFSINARYSLFRLSKYQRPILVTLALCFLMELLFNSIYFEVNLGYIILSLIHKNISKTVE